MRHTLVTRLVIAITALLTTACVIFAAVQS